ncbi:MAG: hypothetical protein IKN09_03035 [Clostridia bacterium]|nr:hypothetical protein [Clostridia bacterium]
MRILKDALIILYVIIAIISTILLLSFNKYKVSVFGDYSIVIVDSNELEPSFSKGDLVIVKSSSIYKVGENVFFYNIVDRKVQVTLANISKVEEVTDGMSGYEIPGGSLISHEEVIGSTLNVKVFHHIGSLVRFIESKYGYLVLIVIPSGAALLYEIYNFVVIRKEELEEEKAEEERRKKLAKKRAKERLLAKKQEAAKNENSIEENDDIVIEIENEPKEEIETPKSVPLNRDVIKNSIEQNKKAYEERIQKLKNNYGKKVENHPEIADDADLKVTNQSDKIEKENDLKEKENSEASKAVRKTPVKTHSAVRRVPTRNRVTNNVATGNNPISERRKVPVHASVHKTTKEESSIKTAVESPSDKKNSAVHSARRTSLSTAKRIAAMKNNAEKNSEAPKTTNHTTATRTTARRSSRIQSKRIVNNRKLDEKD